MIIAGKYEGNYIVLNDKQVSFISRDPTKLSGATFVSSMYRGDIESISKVSEHASGNKERIALWLGSITAAGMSETKIFVIKIVWWDGQESLANVTEYQYQYVLATQMKSAPTISPKIDFNNIGGKKYCFTVQYLDGAKRTLDIALTPKELIYQYTSDKSFVFDTDKQEQANQSGTLEPQVITEIKLTKNNYLTKLEIWFNTLAHDTSGMVNIANKPIAITSDSFIKNEGLEEFAVEVEAFVKRQKPTFSIKYSKNGCYVATCIYGSYDCPEVWTLRRFRDNTLANTWHGRAFIRAYYAISPTIVKWFGNTTWFKKMWKGTLDRMVKKLETNGVENTPYNDKNW
ncbi:MAG: hypothetical protein IJW79_09740 [Clostridia bacterium]|nr:hypothetical protein [Clostridia bacterium]